MGKAYLGLVVWLGFFDELWTVDPVGWKQGAGLAFLALILATVFCGEIWFFRFAWWGLETGLSELELAAWTFGTRGGRWLFEIGLAIAQLAIYALALGFAVETTLLGLVACGVIGPESLRAIELGPIHWRPLVFLTTAAFWIFITAKAEALGLVGVIAALMRVYAPTALVVITVVGLWIGLGRGMNPPVAAAETGSGVRFWAGRIMVGFLVVAASRAVSWGAQAKSLRSLRLGTFVGLELPAVWVAVVSYLAVRASSGASLILPADLAPAVGSFRGAVLERLNPMVAGVVLIALGLAGVAPAYFACHGYTERLQAQGGPRKRSLVIWVGAACAFLLVAPRPWLRLGEVARLLGVLITPLLGAMWVATFEAGKFPRRKPRRLHAPGVLAWLAGAAVGLALDGVAGARPMIRLGDISTMLAPFFAASLVYFALTRLSRLGKAKANRHN